ncbi:MAG: tRNA uridine-5-carboxymethylaminomethyl(34) synthesis GTPase MnmE [Burkholderiaceae bacterium]
MTQPSGDDPIVALASAPGRGAIGVIRLSGRDLGPVLKRLFAAPLQPRYAHYGPLRDASGDVLDHGIAIHFPSPHSYTGEDVLELQAHGGPVVMQLLMQALLEIGRPMGLRLARAGEFTERAFLNGKLDLAQAEAVADLIDAGSAQAARMAARSLAGEFSSEVGAIARAMLDTRMVVEAGLDFPEEEIDILADGDVLRRVATIESDLRELLATARQGALLREGMVVAIAGRPNVGKSSLLNALARAEVAIVTDLPGTTRDRLSQTVLIDGVPVEIIDTAGLRETDDPVERIGIERARETIGRADVVLWLVDARDPDQSVSDRVAADAIAAARQAGATQLQVLNKIDLTGEEPGEGDDGGIRLSAKSGAGLEVLRRRLLALAGWQGAGEARFIARERHLQAMQEAAAHLEAVPQASLAGPELMAEELRLAHRALGRITGEVTADDLLGEIFGRFCIGK